MVGATNLTTPLADVFATFSWRGTELSRTDVISPRAAQQQLSIAAVADTAAEASRKDGYSHVWSAQRKNSTCTLPLPEESVDRRETEIEIDLWEDGGPEKEHGNHLGQVQRTVDGTFMLDLLRSCCLINSGRLASAKTVLSSSMECFVGQNEEM